MFQGSLEVLVLTKNKKKEHCPDGREGHQR
jgi:hypothetical protein